MSGGQGYHRKGPLLGIYLTSNVSFKNWFIILEHWKGDSSWKKNSFLNSCGGK